MYDFFSLLHDVRRCIIFCNVFILHLLHPNMVMIIYILSVYINKWIIVRFYNICYLFIWFIYKFYYYDQYVKNFIINFVSIFFYWNNYNNKNDNRYSYEYSYKISFIRFVDKNNQGTMNITIENRQQLLNYIYQYWWKKNILIYMYEDIIKLQQQILHVYIYINNSI